MTKKTFALRKDPDTEFSYIAKVMDEETKNHKETDSEIITGFMPEIPYCKMCPVQSFLTYLYSLSPEVDHLWQTPKFTDFPANPRIRTYYGPTPVGHNTLDSFVTKIARKCGLQENGYTNHSLRVTAITSLTRNKFSNKEIMAITGHKSSSSLEIYQRVHSEEKMKMGHTLGLTLVQEPKLPTIMPPLPQSALPAPQASTPLQTINMNQLQTLVTPQPAVLPIQPGAQNQQNEAQFAVGDPFEIPDDQIVSIVQEVEAENEEFLMSQTTKKFKSSDGSSITSEHTVAKKSSPKLPLVFHGCKIEGNITINIQK